MLPALGKPLVVRLMNRLHRSGIKNYIVVLGEKEGDVANYINQKWLVDVDIEFILKRDVTPLGQTLSQIAQSHPQPMLIVNYNSFTHGQFPNRLLNYHDLTPDDLILSGGMNSLSRSQQRQYVGVSIPNGNIGYATTPRADAERVQTLGNIPMPHYSNLILGDIVVGGSDFMQHLSDAPDDICRADTLFDITQAYYETGHTVRVARTSWVLQVQADEDLLTLNRHLLDEKIDANILSELPYTVKIAPPVRIDPGVSIGQGATIGPHVYLERGSSIGREAQVTNAIVLRDCAVEAHETLQNAVVSSRGRLQFR